MLGEIRAYLGSPQSQKVTFGNSCYWPAAFSLESALPLYLSGTGSICAFWIFNQTKKHPGNDIRHELPLAINNCQQCRYCIHHQASGASQDGNDGNARPSCWCHTYLNGAYISVQSASYHIPFTWHIILPGFDFDLDIVCFIPSFSCGYYAVSSVSVSAATPLAYDMYLDTCVIWSHLFVFV